MAHILDGAISIKAMNGPVKLPTPSLPASNHHSLTLSFVGKCAFQEVCGDSSLITLLYKSPSANLASYSRKITIIRSYDRCAHLVPSLRSSRTIATLISYHRYAHLVPSLRSSRNIVRVESHISDSSLFDSAICSSSPNFSLVFSCAYSLFYCYLAHSVSLRSVYSIPSSFPVRVTFPVD